MTLGHSFELSLYRRIKLSLSLKVYMGVQLTNPSSGTKPSVFCFGCLAMVPSAVGMPVDVKQFRSFSLSLI